MNVQESYMAIALAESKKALPDCLPNPPVGCVIVYQGEIIAKGFTQAPGGCHAEAMALNDIAGDLAAYEVYVTLEPCSFVGRTPSCAQTLIQRQAKKVYVSMLDPDPRNLGAGIRAMEQAGIDVHIGLLQTEVQAFLASYLNLPENLS